MKRQCYLPIRTLRSSNITTDFGVTNRIDRSRRPRHPSRRSSQHNRVLCFCWSAFASIRVLSSLSTTSSDSPRPRQRQVRGSTPSKQDTAEWRIAVLTISVPRSVGSFYWSAWRGRWLLRVRLFGSCYSPLRVSCRACGA